MIKIKEMSICRCIAKRWKTSLAYILMTTFSYYYFLNNYIIAKSFEFYIKSKRSSIVTIPIDKKQNNGINLDGCYHVYIDLGSNIGVQVRKLFEPRLYPEARVHPVFNSNFGAIEVRTNKSNNLSICAIGFEPNPSHKEYLKEIESSYNKCGWQVTFFTETAVSNRAGTAAFYTDADKANLEWGSGILSPEINNIANKTSSNVKLIRLSHYLNDVVGKRKIPKINTNSPKPKVIMKMDVEGSEVDIIPDLLFNGGLQFVNILMIEWHKRLEILPERRVAQELLVEIMDRLNRLANITNTKEHDFKLVTVDDEKYHNSRFKLPNC